VTQKKPQGHPARSGAPEAKQTTPEGVVRAPGSRTAFLWGYAHHYPWYWFFGMVSLLATTTFSALIPWQLKEGVEALQSPAPVQPVHAIALTIMLLALLQGIFRILSRTIVYFAAREIEFEIRNDLFTHLLGLPMSFYDRTPSGEVLSRSSNDTSDIRLTLGSGFIQVLNASFSVTAALTMMAMISPRLTLAVAVLSPVLAICFRLLSKRNYRLSKQVQEGLARISAKVTENLTGLATVQAHGQEAREIEIFQELDKEYRNSNLELARYRAMTWPITGVISGMATVVLILYGGTLVLRGDLKLGEFVAFQGYVALLQWPMVGLGWVLNVIQRGFAAVDRIRLLLAIQTDTPEPEFPQAIPEDLGEGLVIRDLHFAYPQAGLEDLAQRGRGVGPEVLRGVNLQIRPGERVALVGTIGSGKSTLVDLLVRLYPVDDGHITLGGVDINAVSTTELRSLFGFVPQDRFLFSRSLRENLLMGDPQADNQKMLDYARMAQLEKDVLGFPGGFDTLLGERGVTLSGGQRQRACLTRALVREPHIMVLDDTFSAVDTHTEEDILTALREHREDILTLLITHRPSTMREADRICLMEEGRIVEEGSHQELIDLGGHYANLVQLATLREELGLEPSGTEDGL
jgi:ATP-binding cassette subfamily B protein